MLGHQLCDQVGCLRILPDDRNPGEECTVSAWSWRATPKLDAGHDSGCVAEHPALISVMGENEAR